MGSCYLGGNLQISPDWESRGASQLPESSVVSEQGTSVEKTSTSPAAFIHSSVIALGNSDPL